MQKNQFLQLLDELIEVELGTLKGPELLSNLESWNSLTILGFIALADEKFDIAVSAKRLNECKTVDDLICLLGYQMTTQV